MNAKLKMEAQMAKARAWFAEHPAVALVAVFALMVATRKVMVILCGGGAFLVADTSWVASVFGSKSQDNATKANTKNVNATNELNRKMFEESRGEGGSAVLPLYLKNKDGSLFESKVGKDLIGDYDKTRGEMPDFEATQAGYKPMMTGARDTGAGIFNGGVRKELENNFAPVKAARVNYSRQAAVDALGKTLGQINAMQAGRGFSGDSMGDRMLRFQANKGSADMVAGANMQNVQDERGIADTSTNLRLSNLNLPFTLANENIEFDKAPHDAYIDEVMKGLQPFSFLRIGGSQPFTYQNKPTVQPGMGVGDAMAVNAAGNAGTAGTEALRKWLAQKNNGTGTNSTEGSPDYQGADGSDVMNQAGTYSADTGGGAGVGADFSGEM